MMTKTELQDYLSIQSLSKLNSLIKAAKLDETASTFTDEQVAILEGFASTKPSTPSPNPANAGSLSMPSGSNLPAIGDLAQRNFQNALQSGKQLAQQETVAMASAYAQEKAVLTQQFFSMVEQVNAQAYIDVESTLSALPQSNNEGFFTAMLPQGTD